MTPKGGGTPMEAERGTVYPSRIKSSQHKEVQMYKGNLPIGMVERRMKENIPIKHIEAVCVYVCVTMPQD